MFVGRLGVLVRELAMFVSLVGVLLSLFVLAEIVVVSGLMMTMCGGVVMSRRLMMMLAGRMLRGVLSRELNVRNASSRRTRSVWRDVRWRWTLNVLWTAA
jgi:hypothetical protein